MTNELLYLYLLIFGIAAIYRFKKIEEKIKKLNDKLSKGRKA